MCYIEYSATLIRLENRDTTPVDGVPIPNINYGINLNESEDGTATILDVGSDIYFDHQGQAFRTTGSSWYSIPIEQQIPMNGPVDLENFQSKVISELIYQHLSRQTGRVALVTEGAVLLNPPPIALIFINVVRDLG